MMMIVFVDFIKARKRTKITDVTSKYKLTVLSK